MLIDVSRRPVRLIYEECPSALVVRTMSVRGGAAGLLHRERINARTKAEALDTVMPQAKLFQGDIEYLETVLRDNPTYVQEFRRDELARRHATRPWEAPIMEVPRHEQVEPYHVVSGYRDQFTKKQSQWRLNLVFGSGPTEDRRILTVLDETHSAVLFTVQVPKTVEDIKVLTPLERYLRTPEGGSPGNLWTALIDDDDEL